MPHLRNRYLLETIKKRMAFFPVVGLQGARQVGKSALVSQLLPKSIHDVQYVTLDQPTALLFARSNPESFLQSQLPEVGTLAIDEAQKVPAIFDAIKFVVDQRRVPGRFILLGSTEFSQRTLIRESLTGRIGMLRLFPFTLAEAMEIPPAISPSALQVHTPSRVTRGQLMKHLRSGGMPGAFHIRDEATRAVFFNEWINLIVLRDLMLVPRVKLNPDLARNIMEQIALLDEPSVGRLAKALKTDPRRIRTHIDSLEALFVIHKLNPHPLGTGQPIYFHCDVGMATFLGASFERQLQTWVLQELLASAEWRSEIREKFFYYQTARRSLIHFILERPEHAVALKIIAKESVTELDIKILQAFAKKRASSVELIALGPQNRKFEHPEVRMVAWEAVA
jgi:uncharacterized protein